MLRVVRFDTYLDYLYTWPCLNGNKENNSSQLLPWLLDIAYAPTGHVRIYHMYLQPGSVYQ